METQTGYVNFKKKNGAGKRGENSRNKDCFVVNRGENKAHEMSWLSDWIGITLRKSRIGIGGISKD